MDRLTDATSFVALGAKCHAVGPGETLLRHVERDHVIFGVIVYRQRLWFIEEAPVWAPVYTQRAPVYILYGLLFIPVHRSKKDGAGERGTASSPPGLTYPSLSLLTN